MTPRFRITPMAAALRLLVAAVLAVSPVAVSVAHEVRPDVVLGFFAIVALLILDRLDGSRQLDAIGGVGVGMGGRPNRWGRHLAVASTQDGRIWTAVETTPGRAQPGSRKGNR